MSRLLIVQPYVPSYRVPLFKSLRQALRQHDIEMAVAAGSPQGDAALRLDDATESSIDFLLPNRSFSLGSRRINIRRLDSALSRFNPEMIIVEQAIKNLEIYPLLVRQITGRGPHLATWGQGRSYSTGQSAAEARVKQWVTQRCDWFFAYTRGGADYVESQGFDPSRVTALGNTIDTDALTADLAEVSETELNQFRIGLRLTQGRVGLFLGGVDPHKGIDFLLECALQIERDCPGFVLLVGGSGSQANMVRELEASGGPVRYLGRLDGHSKALALKAADLLLIPEWVGLVAVDSLVAGVPIVTTHHASHSPEFEYLIAEVNCSISQHTIDSYAEQVASLLQDPSRLFVLGQNALGDSTEFSLQKLVLRFTDGVRRWQNCID